MADNAQLSETQKVLRAAQMLFDQGKIAAAEAIFKNILAEVGDESLEGALCLSNLTDIHEAKGDLPSALDCGLRLLRHTRQKQPLAVEAARAEQASELMTRLGQRSEAAQMKQHAERIYQRAEPSQPLVHTQQLDPGDPNWLIHSLKNGAYKAFERSRRQKFEQKQHASQEPSKVEEQAFVAPPQSTNLIDHGLQLTPETKPDRQDAEFLSDGDGDGVEQYGRETLSSSPSRRDSPRAAEQKFSWQPDGDTDDSSDAATAEAPLDTSNRNPDRAPPPAVRNSEMRADPRAEPSVVRDSKGPDPPSRPTNRHTRTASLRGLDAAPGPSPTEAVAGLFSRFMAPTTNEIESAPQNPTEYRRPNRALNFMASLAIIAVVVFAAWRFTPRVGDADALFARMPHRFIDAPRSTVLTLHKVHELELSSGSDSVQANLEYYFGDWRDLLTLTFFNTGPAPYFLSQDAAGLKDQDGTMFYISDSPELQLAQRTKFLLDDANSYFQEHGAYPSKIDQFRPVDITYDNPITKKKKQTIDFVLLKFGNGTSDQDADDARAQFYQKIADPQFWNTEQKIAPGGIKCMTAIFKSKRGDINSFVVSAAGATGEVLTGSQRFSAFRLASEDGKEREQKPPPLRHNFTAWLTVKPITTQLNFWLNNAAWMALGAIAFMTLSLGLSSAKRGADRPTWFLSSGIFALAAAFYLAVTYFRAH